MWRAEDAPAGELPRAMQVGPVTLDLFHRDAHVAGRWLRLHPREFAVFWHLAERPGRPVPRAHLLRHVWRLDFDPQTNRVAVAVCRIRARLRAVGVEGLIATVPGCGYLLCRPHEALDSPAPMRDDAGNEMAAGG